ncbi:thioredoxin domain-containing protein [Candidatus Peregrinibacteria bacterium]|nr:thioredoxin domain-containing protein [Candidatus Peregrinibacteria bacterium]
MQKALLCGLTLMLVGCLSIESRRAMPEEHTQISAEGEASSSKIVFPLFGSGAIAERILETGILEIGNREAPLVLLLFTNHSCRYCRQFQEDLYPLLLKEFIEPGVLRLQVTVLPLQKYPQSRMALTSILCAAHQGKGAAMHNLLFSIPINQQSILAEIEEWPMDRDLFRSCQNDPVIGLRIAELESLARSLHVTLVPTFFLNGEKFVGLPDAAELRGRIETKQREVVGK